MTRELEERIARVLSVRDDPPNPATRILNISDSTGKQVNMAVEDRLPSRLTHVDPDVESRDLGVAYSETCTGIFKQALDGVAFWLVQIEVVRDCRRGIASMCPSVTGNPSRTRTASGFSAISSLSSNSQNIHLGSRVA